MEMGMVFWIAIIYSVVGWFLFRSIARVAFAKFMKNRKEVEVSGQKLLVAIFLLLVGAVISGPMTWGNAIRFWITQKEQAGQK